LPVASATVLNFDDNGLELTDVRICQQRSE
jgi:hypothetical protein